MGLELLISAINADPEKLIRKMNVETPAVLINQCGVLSEKTHGDVRVFSYDERGVGKSRNHAIDNSKEDILLFSDDDIVYDRGYGNKVISEFEKHPEADALFFNVRVCEERRTYWNDDFSPVKLWNAGRYPAYSLAIRREKLIECGVRFSELFGGGAKYSCGEDSLFFKDCLQNGLKMFRTSVVIGEEEKREDGKSTWFNGYDEKFFFDRGVLYYFLYGKLAVVMGFRFVFTKKSEMCKSVPWKKAFGILKKGIREGKKIKDE